MTQHDENRWRRPVLRLALALATTFGAAQATAQPDGRTTCIEGATLASGVGPMQSATLCWAEGRIVQVGGGPPAGATVIDGSGHLVTPGLVAVGAAVGLSEVSAVPETVDTDAGGDDPVRAAFRVADGFDAFSDLVPLARSGGVTSAVLLPSGGLVSGQGAWVDLRDGSPPPPATAERGPLVFQMDGRAAVASGGARGGLMLFYRELLDDARTWAARPQSFDMTRLREIRAGRLDLEALAALLAGELPWLVRASSATDLRAAIALGSAFGITPAFHGAHDAWAIAEELAAQGTWVLVHPFENLPRSFESLGAREDAAARLHAAGVPLILVADETHNARNLRFVAGNAVRAGLPWEAALAAITSSPARWLGLDAEVGSLEVGKRANLVLWTGDPFEPRTRVVTVWVAGEVAGTRSRADALYERYAPPRAAR